MVNLCQFLYFFWLAVSHREVFLLETSFIAKRNLYGTAPKVRFTPF